MNSYDTREGIASYLADGLAGLHRLAKHRHEAGYGRRERLAEWIVLGRWWLDTCGNLMVVHEEDRRLPPIADRGEAFRPIEPHFTFTTFRLPPLGDVCPRCGRGWDLDGAHDVAWLGEKAHHILCAEYFVHEEVRDAFASALRKAGYAGFVLRAIPNRYGSGAGTGPWFLVETKEIGTIRIGWRKRVVDVDWSGSRVPAADWFAEEETTRGEHYVHAWGYDKLVEYLFRLRVQGGDRDRRSVSRSFPFFPVEGLR